jgi:hypothetical protein
MNHALPHSLRSPSQLPQLPNAQRIMPLRQPDSRLIARQIAVKIIRHTQPQRPKQKNLPRRGLQQIRPAHNFGDPHSSIVHHHSQLISRHIIAPPNNKIPKVAPRHKSLRPKMQIRKTNLLSVGNPKPPIQPRGIVWDRVGACPEQSRRDPVVRSEAPLPYRRPTCPRIHRLIIPLIRSPRGHPHILPRTRTRINHPPLAQRLPSPQIMPTPLTLRIRTTSPAAVRPLAPLNSQPAQIFIHCRHKLRPTALRIQILIAEDQLAMMLSRPSSRNPECPRMPQMQQPSRRRRKPTAVASGRIGG